MAKSRISTLGWALAAALLTAVILPDRGRAEPPPAPTEGELRIAGPSGELAGVCPLEHTEVEADVAGFVARVRVHQVFSNPLPEKIEAVYVFPLPQDAAVDGMTMTVGERHITAQIKPREEARRLYEQARGNGHVAGLLDQERPNIFTQSVANIEPGARVEVEITYVETLQYEDGEFQFVFPMVVGPRYVPGSPTGKQGTGWSPDTDRVPDGSRITPPVAAPGTRAGHDIGLTVHIDAGMEIRAVKSELHEIDTRRLGAGRVDVSLRDAAEIPNRDFILRYRTASDQIGDSLLVHRDQRGRFFTLFLQPPRRVEARQAVPKEMIFVIDRSGSMSGFPIEKAKETMRLAIEHMNPDDTFNLLSFAGGTGRCFDRPRPNTAENRAVALRYLADLYGGGGTEMMPAIREALEGQPQDGRIRVVAFMTDGYIGNDFEIIDAVKKNAGTARVFSFGIGQSVNRFLLDGMAHAGRGEVEYVTLSGDADQAVQRFQERIHSPVLTDIAIDWGDLEVSDVYPKQIPDLFSSKPILVHGRLKGSGNGTITLRGHTAAGAFERRIEVHGDAATDHPALPSLWARAAVADLMMRDYAALQSGSFPKEIRDEITGLGVEFHLVTQFTSFVAVEESTVTAGGEPRVVAVPVEMPDGGSYEGVFGKNAAPSAAAATFYRGAPLGQAQAEGAVTKDALSLRQRAANQPIAKVPDSDEARWRLAAPLRGLAAAVEKSGQNGSLLTPAVRVERYRIEISVRLSDSSAATMEALRRLGFTPKVAGKPGAVVTGTIDVRKLEELAGLPAVVFVTPVLS
jgi:Ca-activated chloride channel homolog